MFEIEHLLMTLVTALVTGGIAGGQLNLTATYDPGESEGGPKPNSIEGYVTGILANQSSPHAVPDATISSELSSLYGAVTIPGDSSFSPYTPALMTQIAAWESRPYCQQFFNPPDSKSMYPYGVIDSWPVDSGASFIGLMQVPLSQQNAWDWIQNGTNAVICPKGKIKTCYKLDGSEGGASFQFKLILANSNMVAMQKGKTPALGALSSCQLEEMALALYGPYPGGTDPSSQYYLPTCTGTPNGNTCSGGIWQWTINDSYSGEGIPEDPYCATCYVAYVRTHYLPGDSFLSSCGETSGVPDPPTLASCSSCKRLGAPSQCY